MSEWISTRDLLPREGDLVAVEIKGVVQYSLAILWSGTWRWLAAPDADYAPWDTVTHWMPVTEAPNGKG